ncbi:hypothetical protein C8J56DRAFT_248667 [Mycena floridula]|nr:hypothetical protein C8J56DRAFT_248667 [Mycena floridula]
MLTSFSEDYYPFLKSLREVDQIRALIVTPLLEVEKLDLEIEWLRKLGMTSSSSSTLAMLCSPQSADSLRRSCSRYLCSIKLQDAHSRGLDSLKPVRLERLRSLCFHSDRIASTWCHRWPHFIAPSLGSSDSTRPCDALDQLLIRSETAPLPKLSLHFHVPPSTSPINCLRFSPEVDTFSE